MRRFLESEKRSQTIFKEHSPYFSNEGRLDGKYKGKLREFCLPDAFAHENLFPEIRELACEHFAKYNIKWHDGHNGKPSNHLCDSQVCCVNFLFPFANKPRELAAILGPYFPIEKMLIAEGGQYVTFEWIGERNYLGERISRNGTRSRGANFTSADAIIRFERKDGKRQVVLIEWKYTESYGSTSLKIARSGTDRTKIYQPLFDKEDCPLDKKKLTKFEDLFYEPFYQLMRQQVLANEMEKHHELGADIVSVFHIAPFHNTDFRVITSPELKEEGKSVLDVWGDLVKNKDRFTSVTTEILFGGLSRELLPKMDTYIDYIHARYPWIHE